MSEQAMSFYRGRIESAHLYGFSSGHAIIESVCRAAAYDSELTEEEIEFIINLCEIAHIKMMEENYNAE